MSVLVYLALGALAGWLAGFEHLTVLKASPADAFETPLRASPGIASTGAGAGNLFGLLVARLTNGGPSLSWRGGAPCRAHLPLHLCQHSWRHVEWT